ncbi:hypothetical protein [Bdellovibrio sp. HCB209]|uniref:hypothetical protein n=1 Tax=Bdellovibrio sp. HCB209 TaxID=3394354 RepID=UPI0039B388AB
MKFLGATSTHKENIVNIHLKIVHIGNADGTEIGLRINTNFPAVDVGRILTTKKPSNWYNELIQEIESQFAELSRLASS